MAQPLPQVTRRRLLTGTAATVGAFALGGTVAACRNDGGPGGTRRLRVGAAGLATATSLDPRLVAPGVAAIAYYHLYDSLLRLEGGDYALQLAESIEPNADATAWTVRLRDGAEFHNGRRVRAVDVIYSLKVIANPALSPAFGVTYADMNADGLRALDDRTVRIPLRRPRGDFRDAVLSVGTAVFPEGTNDFEKAIGSGPYRLVANDPGKSVRLRANESYWGGPPKFETLELVTIGDPTARLNGVRSGQLDYAVGISPTGARTAAASDALEIHRGGPANGNALMLAMNQTKAPFDDPSVRSALRLVVDRRELVDHVLFGQATIGNDVVGKGLPGYADDLRQRAPDLDSARDQLAGAGVSELNLRSANLLPGLQDASRIFAQQAKPAGVDVTIDPAQPDTYFTDRERLLTTPFQAFYVINRPAAVHLSLVIGPRAPFNVMGYGADYERRLTAVQGTVDDAARQAGFAELQHELYEHGSEIVWAFQETLDASIPGIAGIGHVQSSPVFGRARIS
jgi:peptide/nickel transport system substrate-binding protein